MIRYRSTRACGADSPDLGFGDVLVAGLAPDGGLFCPVDVPRLDQLRSITADTPYVEAATTIIAPFVEGTFDEAELGEMVAAAYAGFRHPDVCPVVPLGPGRHLLDLTRGPTLAFKDMALQLVARMLDAELSRRGQQVTVIGATSGDTGSAAIEALAGRSNIKVVILHPLDRVSEVQRRQMTTVDAANIANLAVRGTFDDCQDLVKGAFADSDLRAEMSLAAVNSINWGRVVSQIPYYVHAARRVSPDGAPVTFSVPTGNFGNVLAGWYGKRMGLAVDRFIVASNRNDVLTRFFQSGSLIIESVEPSLSPSMDIQVSSNFERLLWEAGGRVGQSIVELLTTLRSEGRVEVPSSWCQVIANDFCGLSLDDNGTLEEMAEILRTTERLVDPHTAVGTYAARKLAQPGTPVIALATADPAKFPDAVLQATGRRPELPPHLAELFERTEQYEVIDNSSDSLAAILRNGR